MLKDKAKPLFYGLGCPVAVRRDTQLQLESANGSHIIALPGVEKTVRSYSAVKLLVIDEASRVPDPLFYSLSPMLSVARGKMVALSTPAGCHGWYWNEWSERGDDWKRVAVRSDQCPRHKSLFLADERRRMRVRCYRRHERTLRKSSIEERIAGIVPGGTNLVRRGPQAKRTAAPA
jgi:hypothetical protein